MDLVAIQGVKGSYSEEAAHRILGDSANILECSNFEQTFAEISSRHAAYGVVPFRNKIVGDIEIPHNLLKRYGLSILDKLDLEVRHVLVGAKDAEFENLISVRSHIEALKQCKRFLSQYPLLDRVIGADTASSVRRIVEENIAAHGAIGSRRAAEIYGAKILKENIADDFNNWTTFYLIGN